MTRQPRPLAANILAVVGSVCLFVGAIYTWAAPTLFDSSKFAARARVALDESPALRQVVARTLVVDPGGPVQLPVGRPAGGSRLVSSPARARRRAVVPVQPLDHARVALGVFYERGDLFGVVDTLNDELVEPG